ncbi:MAG: hypothetical protein ABSC18_12850 [Verrucomicrobiota bacterium]|jgi:hypothetical protein
MQFQEDFCRKGAQRGQPQPKEWNHGFHGFHGFEILHVRLPRNGLAQKHTKATKKNSSSVSFPSVQKKSVLSVLSVPSVVKYLQEGATLTDCRAKNAKRGTYVVFSLRSLRSFAANFFCFGLAAAGVLRIVAAIQSKCLSMNHL